MDHPRTDCAFLCSEVAFLRAHRAIDHGIPISTNGEFDPEILDPKEVEIKGKFYV